MRRATLIFALVGFLVAASTIKVLVLPSWIGLLSGPLFALAVLLGNALSRLRYPLGLSQYLLMALLYSASHALLVPAAWSIFNLHFTAGDTLIELGPTIGVVAAGVSVLIGLRLILKRPAGGWRALTLAGVALFAGESIATLLELWGRFYRFAHYQPATSSMMVSFAVLCGYLGYELSTCSASRSA